MDTSTSTSTSSAPRTRQPQSQYRTTLTSNSSVSSNSSSNSNSNSCTSPNVKLISKPSGSSYFFEDKSNPNSTRTVTSSSYSHPISNNKTTSTSSWSAIESFQNNSGRPRANSQPQTNIAVNVDQFFDQIPPEYLPKDPFVISHMKSMFGNGNAALLSKSEGYLNEIGNHQDFNPRDQPLFLKDHRNSTSSTHSTNTSAGVNDININKRASESSVNINNTNYSVNSPSLSSTNSFLSSERQVKPEVWNNNNNNINNNNSVNSNSSSSLSQNSNPSTSSSSSTNFNININTNANAPTTSPSSTSTSLPTTTTTSTTGGIPTKKPSFSSPSSSSSSSFPNNLSSGKNNLNITSNTTSSFENDIFAMIPNLNLNESSSNSFPNSNLNSNDMNINNTGTSTSGASMIVNHENLFEPPSWIGDGDCKLEIEETPTRRREYATKTIREQVGNTKISRTIEFERVLPTQRL